MGIGPWQTANLVLGTADSQLAVVILFLEEGEFPDIGSGINIDWLGCAGIFICSKKKCRSRQGKDGGGNEKRDVCNGNRTGTKSEKDRQTKKLFSG